MWNVAKSHLKTYIPTIQSRMAEVFSTGCSLCSDHIKNGLSLNVRESMLTVEVKSVSKEGKLFSRRNRTIRGHQNKHMILCTRLVCIDIHVGREETICILCGMYVSIAHVCTCMYICMYVHVLQYTPLAYLPKLI